MHEPHPRMVAETELRDRIIRVGIVLEEDRLQRIDAMTFDTPLTCNGSLIVEPHTRFCIALENHMVVLRSDAGIALASGDHLALQFRGGAVVSPALQFSSIVTGRGFHWSKKIEAVFPGEFECHAKSGSIQIVNIVTFEVYLACVVVSEMSAEAPREFVRAQAIAARSWAVCFLQGKHPGSDFELCNDDDCQRYHGLTYANPEALENARSSYGQFLFDSDGYVVPGYYSKSCGGITEPAEACFGLSLDGLVSIVDGELAVSSNDVADWLALSSRESAQLNCGADQVAAGKFLGGVDDAGEYFRWQHTVSKLELAEYLNVKTTIDDAVQVVGLTPLQRGVSFRVHRLEISYETSSGEIRSHVCKSQYVVRSLLHASFLYSSAIDIVDQGEKFVFFGAGWGHGVGLCQMGACYKATHGSSCEEILKHYFPRSILKRCY